MISIYSIMEAIMPYRTTEEIAADLRDLTKPVTDQLRKEAASRFEELIQTIDRLREEYGQLSR